MTLPATMPAGGPSEDPESLSPADGFDGEDSSSPPPMNVASEALVAGAEEVELVAGTEEVELVAGAEEVELEALRATVLEVVPTEED